jgi:hypothetical protein
MPAHGRLLCVGKEDLELRCAVLASAGYDAKSAKVSEAELLLQAEKFDLIVVSVHLSQEERDSVKAAAGNTPILLLEGITFPPELLAEVERMLESRQRQQAIAQGETQSVKPYRSFGTTL